MPWQHGQDSHRLWYRFRGQINPSGAMPAEYRILGRWPSSGTGRRAQQPPRPAPVAGASTTLAKASPRSRPGRGPPGSPSARADFRALDMSYASPTWDGRTSTPHRRAQPRASVATATDASPTHLATQQLIHSDLWPPGWRHGVVGPHGPLRLTAQFGKPHPQPESRSRGQPHQFGIGTFPPASPILPNVRRCREHRTSLH